MVSKRTPDRARASAIEQGFVVPPMGTPEAVEAVKRGRGRPRKEPAEQPWQGKVREEAPIPRAPRRPRGELLKRIIAERDLIDTDLRLTRKALEEKHNELERCARRGEYQTAEIARLNGELAAAKEQIANQLEYIGNADRAVQRGRHDVVTARAQAEFMRLAAYPKAPLFPWEEQ